MTLQSKGYVNFARVDSTNTVKIREILESVDARRAFDKVAIINLKAKQ